MKNLNKKDFNSIYFMFLSLSRLHAPFILVNEKDLYLKYLMFLILFSKKNSAKPLLIHCIEYAKLEVSIPTLLYKVNFNHNVT